MIRRSSASKSSISFCSDSDLKCRLEMPFDPNDPDPPDPEAAAREVSEIALGSMSESTFSYSLSLPRFL